jgi:uncharacterized membrane protein (DUF485 family)
VRYRSSIAPFATTGTRPTVRAGTGYIGQKEGTRMAETVSREGAQEPAPRIDWEAIEGSPEFRELMAKRRSFVVPGTVFFLSYFMAFILLCGYAPDFMAESVYQGLTVGYCLALTQFVMVAVLGLWYLRKSDREFDPLADRVVEMASRSDVTSARAEPGQRFARDEAGAPTPTTETKP